MLRERKNIRLKDWDYSSEGIYFLTICCRERKSFFGKIENNKMHLSDIGSIASRFWMEIPTHFPHVKLDEFVIMPNHLHGIIILDYTVVGLRHGVALQSTHDNVVRSSQNTNQFSKPLKNSVSVIINQFKSSVKRWCNNNGFVNFEWQPRFYDHLIHDEYSIQKIRAYIKNNSSKWSVDELYI
jgi:putative transposase